MKVIGMIGGMSWESSAQYYRIINETTRTRMGGAHSARSVMYSVDFAAVERSGQLRDWEALFDELADAAARLERAGADFIVICSNTMHRLYDRLCAEIRVPVLHIADATGTEIRAAGHGRVGLLGTLPTMEGEFYRGRLSDKFGIECLIPEKPDRDMVDRIIFDELTRGEIRPTSSERLTGIIDRMAQAGAEAVILGCTELMLLAKPGTSLVPLFDTTSLHARAAVEYALISSGELNAIQTGPNAQF